MSTFYQATGLPNLANASTLMQGERYDRQQLDEQVSDECARDINQPYHSCFLENITVYPTRNPNHVLVNH